MGLPIVDPKNASIWARKPHDILGRYQPHGGIDYGAEGKVLIKDLRTGYMLVWRTGHTAWMSVGQSGYYAAHLDFYGKEAHFHGLGREVCEGGRLGNALIRRMEDKIDEFWGCQIAHNYLHGHTVFIEGLKK